MTMEQPGSYQVIRLAESPANTRERRMHGIGAPGRTVVHRFPF